MLRWLRRWLGYDEEPLVELVGGLSDPEARAWAERLRNQGIGVMVKTSTPLLGEWAGTASDYALCVRASDAARVRQVLTPLLKTHAGPSRQPRRFRRQRGRNR
jgi:hypothetical protein